jgi:hypothetical protein
LFFVAKRYPVVDTAVEGVGLVFGSLLALAQVAVLVRDFRRRRRPHPAVPAPVTPLTPLETRAAVVVTDLLLDHAEEIERARLQRCVLVTLRNEIDFAAATFFMVEGENGEALGAFRSQLARILGGGDPSEFHDYMLPGFLRTEPHH